MTQLDQKNETQEETNERSVDKRTIVITVAAVVSLFAFRPSLGFTLLALLALITVHEAGHFFVARRAGMLTPEFMVGFGPTLWSKRKGGTTYGLKAIPLGGYVRIVGMSDGEEVEPALEQSTYRAKPYRWRVAVSFAGPGANLVFAFLLLTLSMMIVGTYTPDTRPIVQDVVADFPAAQAGLLPGSTITSINNTPVSSWDDVTGAITANGESTIVVQAIDTQGNPYTTSVTPREDQGRVIIGISRGSVNETFGPLEAVKQAGLLTFNITKAAFGAIVGALVGIPEYVGQLFSGSEVQDEQRFLSPLGASEVAEQVSSRGLLNLLPLAAFVNIMLAAFNLLPVPPLDGGHIAVASLEKLASIVKRRPVRIPSRILTPVAVSVWAVLIFIAISALWLDVFTPISL